jgi:thiamine biosynthesis lipoprotein
MKYFISLFCILFFTCKESQSLHKLTGPVFGTTYNIQYYSNTKKDFSVAIDSLFAVVNLSMSNYQDNSVISKLNKNESYTLDPHFVTVFNASKTIYKQTNGVFDPTIGSLVNYWNFGSEQNEKGLDSLKVDSLMQFVGFNQVKLQENKIQKKLQTYIDFNAIAKGYGIDVIADFLLRKNISNYLIEIGGEIRVSGTNLNKESNWKIGIQNPDFNGETSYTNVISLKNESMATSGVYRKFKIDENGNRYAHIIDTKTGYPAKTNILSVSVIAENCMLADGYATALQAMDLDSIKRFINENKKLKVCVIFENAKNEFEVLTLNGFPVN